MDKTEFVACIGDVPIDLNAIPVTCYGDKPNEVWYRPGEEGDLLPRITIYYISKIKKDPQYIIMIHSFDLANPPIESNVCWFDLPEVDNEVTMFPDDVAIVAINKLPSVRILQMEENQWTKWSLLL